MLLITITISTSISLNFDFDNISKIKISYNNKVENILKKNTNTCIFIADSIESFENRQLEKKEVSKRKLQKLIKLLKKISLVIVQEDFFLEQSLDLSFLEGNDEIKNKSDENNIVFINDNYVDVKAIIYVENKNGNINKIAVGNGSYLNIDGHYYKISPKYRNKLLKFIRNELKK